MNRSSENGTRSRHDRREAETIVIGCGPAGLAAAYTLARSGRPVTVIERGTTAGGLSSSFDFEGFILDFGAHIYVAGRPRVQELWDDILGDDQVLLRRKTRMYWAGRYFNYPPRPLEFVRSLGAPETVRIIASLLKSRLAPGRKAANLSESLARRFGRRIAGACFEPYIEKLFGVPCSRIRPDWQPGRLRGSGFFSAIRSAVIAGDDGLVPHPKRGSRQFYEKLVARIEGHGQPVRFGCEAVRIEHQDERVTGLVVRPVGGGAEEFLSCVGQVISTMPVSLLLQGLSPSPPTEVIREIQTLRFRSTILVYLIIDDGDLSKDHCIYINDPAIRIGRIANFANWSPEMAPDTSRTPLCCEIWCDLGDEMWIRSDDTIVEIVRQDIARLGLIGRQAILSTKVIRLPRTHPVPIHTDSRVAWDYLGRFRNLHLVGRAGSFSYQDQDDSILMGIKAADACISVNGAPEVVCQPQLDTCGLSV